MAFVAALLYRMEYPSHSLEKGGSQYLCGLLPEATDAALWAEHGLPRKTLEIRQSGGDYGG